MAIDRASPCATPDEVGFHAVVVISQHYVGDQPAAVQRATAKLWIEHLSAFPAWAIERAVAWWIGPDNPSKNRARRPLPGDIAERCRVEVGCIDKGRQNLAYWRRYGGAYPTFLTGTQPQRALT